MSEITRNIDLVVPKLHIKSGCTLEYVVGQLQTLTDKVLCVEDGAILHVKDRRDTSGNLETTSVNKWCTEYYYRRNDDRLFCYFTPNVSDEKTVVTSTAQPIAQPIAQSTPTAQPIAQSTAQPIAQSTPTAQPIAQSTPQTIPQPTATPTAQTTVSTNTIDTKHSTNRVNKSAPTVTKEKQHPTSNIVDISESSTDSQPDKQVHRVETSDEDTIPDKLVINKPDDSGAVMSMHKY